MNEGHKKERAKWREKIFKYPKTKAETGLIEGAREKEISTQVGIKTYRK